MAEVLSKSEITRRLQWILRQRVRHRSLSIVEIAAWTGLTRTAVYNAANGIMSDATQQMLSWALAGMDVQKMLSDSTIADAGGDPRAGLRWT